MGAASPSVDPHLSRLFRLTCFHSSPTLMTRVARGLASEGTKTSLCFRKRQRFVSGMGLPAAPRLLPVWNAEPHQAVAPGPVLKPEFKQEHRKGRRMDDDRSP